MSINTRPDISFIVNALAQHGSNPQPCHYAAGKRVLRYLAGTIQFRIVYTAEGDNLDLHVYADASWANEIGRRSVTGYTWYYAGGLISYVSKKQTTVALSLTEAEYMAVTHVAQEGLWLRSLFFELGIAFRSPVPIHLDCAGAIALSEAVRFHHCTKHIDIRYHFICLHINNGSFTLIWIPSHLNIADILTKALPHPAFDKFRLFLGLIAP